MSDFADFFSCSHCKICFVNCVHVKVNFVIFAGFQVTAMLSLVLGGLGIGT